jgi:hypothetical protein
MTTTQPSRRRNRESSPPEASSDDEPSRHRQRINPDSILTSPTAEPAADPSLSARPRGRRRVFDYHDHRGAIVAALQELHANAFNGKIYTELARRFPTSTQKTLRKYMWEWEETHQLLVDMGLSPSSRQTVFAVQASIPEDHRRLSDLTFPCFGDLLLFRTSTIRLSSVTVHFLRASYILLWSRLDSLLTSGASTADINQLLVYISILPTIYTVRSPSGLSIHPESAFLRIQANDWSLFTYRRYLRLQRSEPPSPTPPSARALHLLQSGNIQRAYRALSPSSIMRIDAVTADQLEDLHPQRLPIRVPLPASTPVSNTINIPPASIVALLSSIRKHPAPGITNLRYDHIRQCIGSSSTPDEQEFLTRLQRFLMLIANARLPLTFMRFIGSSVLLALPKTGHGIRPIAMGDVFRRMTSSLIQRHFQSQINNIMLPLQLGIGASCGVEKIFHLSQAYLESQQGDIVLLDFQNAFNTVSRSQALSNIAQHLPDLYPYLSAVYNQELWLWHLYYPTPIGPSQPMPPAQPAHILSCEGAQQGDPLGPLFFAMAIMPLLHDLQRLLPAGIVQAYIDDLTIMAPPDQQIRALEYVIQMGPTFGLLPNPSKFKILINPSSPPHSVSYSRLFPSLTAENIIAYDPLSPSTYGISLLGGPLGSPEYCHQFFNLFTQDLMAQINLILQLDHLQSIWCLFIYVIQSLPTHLFRLGLPASSKHLAHRLQPIQLSIVAHIGQLHPCPEFQIPASFPLHSTHILNQLYLPISSGGFLLKHFVHLSDFAFLASILSCYHHLTDMLPSWLQLPLYQSTQNAYLAWQSHQPLIIDQNPFPSGNLPFADWLRQCLRSNIPSVPHLQHHLCSAVSSQLASLFEINLRRSPPTSQVRWHSINQPIAGSFLLAWPKPAWSLTNTQFSVTVRLRLGLPCFEHVCNTLVRCAAENQPIDGYGLHLLTCPVSNQHRRRHDCIVHTVCQLAKLGGISTSTRQSDLTFYTPTGARYADFVLLRPHLDEAHGECSLYGDPTIVNPHSYRKGVENFLRDPSSFYSYHASVKRSIYDLPCQAKGHLFVPMVINTYGNMAPEVNTLLLQLAHRYATHASVPTSVAVQSFQISLITALHRFNANIILEGITSHLQSASPSNPSHPTLIESNLVNSVADRVGVG